jgi:hypothetical protein
MKWRALPADPGPVHEAQLLSTLVSSMDRAFHLYVHVAKVITTLYFVEHLHCEMSTSRRDPTLVASDKPNETGTGSISNLGSIGIRLTYCYNYTPSRTTHRGTSCNGPNADLSHPETWREARIVVG